ncbi:acyl-CoA dehydrogenase family protein [Roseomonas sp. 18066]|uniref:acyl-CoA dehydrogenase family protein n=1 Tax=Roseomonas sp. 18066 TaxID=2681412 RepID=UPI00135953CE|nr:acyl-CoA dehydrogenase family protein [Roseomonas sp. 18066]
MQDLLAEAAGELFSRHCPPALVRRLRGGGADDGLWAKVEEAGFLDALRPEAEGGAGLTPAEFLPVLLAAGRFSVPLPIGETAVARALLGAATPPGPVLIAMPVEAPLQARIPAQRPAEWAILPGDLSLLPLADAQETGAAAPFERRLEWPEASIGQKVPEADWLLLGAWLESAAMAGALEKILESSIAHATVRQQFGRPVAGFQAVQQQLSVLTEEVFAARMAAQLGSLGGGDGPLGLDRARVAVAKTRIGLAAREAAGIAHAVHGAIGITEELELHLSTSRLLQGRALYGSADYWAGWLGRAFLAEAPVDFAGTLDFVRQKLAPQETA